MKRVAIGALVAVFSLSGARGFSRAIDPIDPEARLVRLERWIKAALTHQPGIDDDPLTEVSLWTQRELRLLMLDEKVLERALRLHLKTVPSKVTDDKRIPPYTPGQVRAFIEILEEYGSRHDAILVRGAMLHGDVAMVHPPTSFTQGTAEFEDDKRLKVQIGDGESLGFNGVSAHWDMARALFDLAPRGSEIADVARRWYIATGMWIQQQGQYDTGHLRHARDLFPDDAELQYLSGTQQEAYASPPIQAVIKSAVLPQGYNFDIAQESASLRMAEGFLRRALVLDPKHPEARLHLGHVLLARGMPQEAAVELRQFAPARDDAEMQYFGAMFLGAAEDGAGRLDEARVAYERAIQTYPAAQSPLFALSALAARRGDRAGALKYMQQVFDLPKFTSEPSDPWWNYRYAHARATEELLFLLYKPYIEGKR